MLPDQPYRVLLSAIAVVGFVSCSNPASPQPEPFPVGIYERVEQVVGGEVVRTLRLDADSAIIADTVYSIDGQTRTVDSVYIVEMEINPLADGYYRVAETHRANGAIVSQQLSYRFFFRRGDSLFFYSGIRLRGDQVSIRGTWTTSALDSAFNGFAYEARFTADSLVVTTRTSDNESTARGTYDLRGDTIIYQGGPFPTAFGPRYEIIPGLALYLTSDDVEGYRRIGNLPAS